MKTRIIHTRFWDDSLVCKLTAKEKLLFLYLLTNERNNLIGVYELPDKRIMNDLDITSTELQNGKAKLAFDKKVLFYQGWVKIINHDKYNTFSGEKNEIAKKREWLEVPEKLIGNDTSIDTSIDTDGIPLLINNTNINLNNNTNKSNKKTYTKENLTLQEVADKILIVFNKIMGTKFSNTRVFINNLEKCLESHTPLEIAEAISQIKYDSFWKNVATPEKIFRQSKDGQAKDYIEDLLNSKKENYDRR